jgi:Mg/Co/Ni transporter MgtE
MKRRGTGICAVVNARRVLLGCVGGEVVGVRGDERVGELMDRAPRTVRPNAPTDELARHFRDSTVQTIWVTTSDGELLGSVSR